MALTVIVLGFRVSQDKPSKNVPEPLVGLHRELDIGFPSLL